MPSSIKICPFESCCDERIKRDVKDRVQYMHESGVSLKQKLHTEHASDALLHTEGTVRDSTKPSQQPGAARVQQYSREGRAGQPRKDVLGSRERKLS